MCGGRCPVGGTDAAIDAEGMCGGRGPVGGTAAILGAGVIGGGYGGGGGGHGGGGPAFDDVRVCDITPGECDVVGAGGGVIILAGCACTGGLGGKSPGPLPSTRIGMTMSGS